MLISDGKAALFHHDAQQRALLACVGTSIVRLSAHAGNSTALTATFSPRPRSPETAQATTPRPHEPPRPVLAQSAPAETAAPQPVAPAPVPAPSQAVQTASSAPAPLASAAELQASATSASIDAADASLLERYRLALIDAAKRYRRYPVQAMERGWQGRVEIRVVIGTNGTIKDALIKTSSNYRILDDQALDMVKKALAQIPPAPRGREFEVDVPVIFELQTG
ncbi:MAG: energy transducer TonB [Betaproteobacteria bacterium]|nr:MAG: energy transducer TonB [Betaproteobacteria bacterium]